MNCESCFKINKHIHQLTEMPTGELSILRQENELLIEGAKAHCLVEGILRHKLALAEIGLMRIKNQGHIFEPCPGGIPTCNCSEVIAENTWSEIEAIK